MRSILRSEYARTAFWIAAAVLVFFLPVALGIQSLTEAVPTFYSHPSPAPQIKTPWQVDGGTHTTQTIPSVQAGIEMARSGIPPLWAPYAGGGMPLASDVGAELYYPLRFFFFFAWNSVRAFDWYFLLRFFIAAFGMFFYLKHIGLRRIAAFWGGIAYAFSGYFLLYLTYPFLDIDSLLPWMLLAIERYFRAPGIRPAGVIGIVLALVVLIGQPQSAIIAAFFAALYFVWRAIREHRARRETNGPLLAFARHGAVAVLIALVIALPFAIDFMTAYREGQTSADWYAKGFAHFAPLQLLHFLVTPAMMPEVAAAGHLFDRYELIIPYVGISVLMLFFASISLKQKPFPLSPLYAWILFVILKNAGFPLVQWIARLPIMGQIGWYKAYGPMAGAIVICAAIAFDRLLGNASLFDWKRFRNIALAIPVIFAAAYLAAPHAFSKIYVPNFDVAGRGAEIMEKAAFATRGLPASVRNLILDGVERRGGYFAALLFTEAAVFALIAYAAIFFMRDPRYRRRAAYGMLFLTAFELWMYMPKIRDGFTYHNPYRTTPPYVVFLQTQMEQEGMSRIFSVGKVFRGFAGERYHIQQSQNNAAFKTRRYAAFVPEIVFRNHPLDGEVTARELSDMPEKFFDAFNIRYLLSEEPLPDAPWRKLVYDADIKIYENKNVLPKTYVTFAAQSAVSPEEARYMFYDSSFDPHAAVILETADAAFLLSSSPLTSVPASDANGGASGTVSSASRAMITDYAPDRIAVSAETDRDGILVLSELYYPGWHAYLDGKRVPIYPANVMLRGVAFPAGAHEVIFKYEPRWFWPSVTLSLLMFAGVLALNWPKKILVL